MPDLYKVTQARLGEVRLCRKNWVEKGGSGRLLQPRRRLDCHSKEDWKWVLALPIVLHCLLFLQGLSKVESLHPRWLFRCVLSWGEGWGGWKNRQTPFLPFSTKFNANWKAVKEKVSNCPTWLFTRPGLGLLCPPVCRPVSTNVRHGTISLLEH